jgi:hypothetical protein
MPKVELNQKNGVQKGPATDYSLLLEMKRRTVSIADQNSKTPKGDQNIKPFTREDHMRSGTAPNGGTGAIEFYKLARPIHLSRLKF